MPGPWSACHNGRAPLLLPVPLTQGGDRGGAWSSSQMATLQKSLSTGLKLFDESLGASLEVARMQRDQIPRLKPEDRERVLSALPPPHRIHSLRLSLDRDVESGYFEPWTQAIDTDLDRHVHLRACTLAALTSPSPNIRVARL